MTKDLALPDDYLDQLIAGVAQSRANTILPGGATLLRMAKTGQWIYGMNNEKVWPGTRWLINVASFEHGYVCWTTGTTKNEMLGELMDSMTRDKPIKPEQIRGFPWQEQRSVQVRALDGPAAGKQLLYKVASMSGLREFDGLMREFEAHAVADRAHPYPIVVLGSSSYDHPNYGMIATPVLEVVGWADGNGETGNKPAVAPPKPAKPRKAPASVSPQALRDQTGEDDDTDDTAAPVAPPVASTQALHTGQRRRPTQTTR